MDVFTSIRAVNALMAIALVLATLGVTRGSGPSLYVTSIVLLATALMVMGQALFNDIMDVQLDRLLARTKPIACGRLRRDVWGPASLGMTALSVLLASTVNLDTGTFFLAVAVGLIAYSVWLKKTFAFTANVLSSVLTMALCAIGGLLTGDYLALWILGPTVGFGSLGREIAKDVEDFEADQLFRKRSLAMQLGCARALRVAHICVVVQMAVSYLPCLSGLGDWRYVLLISAANGYGTVHIATYELARPAIDIGSLRPAARGFQIALKRIMMMYVLAFFLL